MNGITEGRIVQYVLKDGDLPDDKKHNVGRVRPAIIVECWGGGTDKVNLSVFSDYGNDGRHEGHFWATSVPYDDTNKPGTWHWPVRS